MTNYKPVLLFYLLCSTLLINCSKVSKKEEASISFTHGGISYHFHGQFDTKSEWYMHRRPDMFSPESIAQDRKKYSHNHLCGRLTSISRDTMFEMIINWPDHYQASDSDIVQLQGDTIWTLSAKRNNWDSTTHKIIDKTTHYLWFQNDREYLSDIDPEGFVYFEQIAKKTDSTWLGKGTFELPMRDMNGKTQMARQGKFYLEFYRGL